MKIEILEPLLLDHALGELSPEVTALLEAYLAQNPEAAARARALNETLALARQAVAPAPETPRALDRARLRREQRFARSLAFRTELLRLAACLALGLGLGWFLAARRVPPAAPVAVAVAPLAPAVTVAPPVRFWSVTRFAPELVKTQPEKRL
jgi:anti-sigma factor RsiW